MIAPPGRVEGRRAGLRSRGVAVAGGFRHSPVPQSRSSLRFLTPRSSNRTCCFPASGFQSGSCLRPRKASCPRPQASETVVLPQPLVREAHCPSGPHLVPPTKPLTQPPDRVAVDRSVGRTDLPQAIVVRPPRHDTVQVFHHLARQQVPVPRRRPLADLAADAPNARLAGSGPDVAPPPSSAFPISQVGRPPHCPFRGLLDVHSRSGPHVR